jgi:TrmH family RNA methyltransferase
MITSAQNQHVQRVRALARQRKARQQAGEFLVEGVRLVEEALQAGWPARLLLFSADLSPRGRALLDQARAGGCPMEELTPALMKSSADTESPQGILGVFARQERPLPRHPDFVVVADGIRDPGNLGTLLRSAAAAGAQAALLAPGVVDAFAPKVLRAGMGAHFRLPLREMGWDAIAAYLKPTCQVYLAEASQGSACWQLDLTRPLALVIGGEAQGAGPQARALADALISIPMPGASESLNAAAAAGILLFEVVRQRSQSRGR